MRTQFLTTGEVRIAYDVTGQGLDLMLLHGAGKTRKDWHKHGYVKRLQEHFRVISVDLRGSGDSDILTGIADYRLEKITADLLAVADDCGVDNFAVWGYSLGGNIARYLASEADRVTAAAIIGVPFGPAVDEDFDCYIDQFIDKYGALAESYNQGELGDKQRKIAIKGRIPVWVACFQAMRGWPAVEPGDLDCPALLLAGSKNRSVMKWLEANPGSLEQAGVQLEIVEGLTHPQEFS